MSENKIINHWTCKKKSTSINGYVKIHLRSLKIRVTQGTGGGAGLAQSV
jgi:hypothetical protein